MLSAPCGSQEVVKRPVSVSLARLAGGLLPEALFLEAVTDFSVVNAEKFGHSAGHGHDGLILREPRSQPIHFGAVGLHRTGDGVELGNRFPDQQFAGVRLGHQRELLPGVRVQVDGRLLGVILSITVDTFNSKIFGTYAAASRAA